MIALELTGGGVVIPVRVRAGARRSGVVGEHDGSLRIDVTTAPDKGKANRAVVAVLSDLLDVVKSSIELISGATNSHKRFLVTGLDVGDVVERIAIALGRRRAGANSAAAASETPPTVGRSPRRPW